MYYKQWQSNFPEPRKCHNITTNRTLQTIYQTLNHVHNVAEDDIQEKNVLIWMPCATIAKKEATMDRAVTQKWMRYPLQKSVARAVETCTNLYTKMNLTMNTL